MGAYIRGWGVSVPRRVVRNEEIEARLGVEASWIEQRTGIKARHVADHESVASLGAEAARKALAVAGVDASSVDTVIVATVTPDMGIPATASLIQHCLGATGAAAYDLNAGCSGFLYALAQANALIVSGTARRVIVVGADTLSRITDHDDRSTAGLFGDGAGAVVLDHCEGTARVGPFLLASDGAQPDLLYLSSDSGKLVMKGRDVYRRAVAEMSEAIQNICVSVGMSPTDVDLFVIHQANARILEAVVERAGLDPAAVVSNIARYGNTSAASIPLALNEAASAGRLDDGDTVVLGAFGAGFTWGAGILRWSAIASEAGAIDFQEMADV